MSRTTTKQEDHSSGFSDTHRSGPERGSSNQADTNRSGPRSPTTAPSEMKTRLAFAKLGRLTNPTPLHLDSDQLAQLLSIPRISPPQNEALNNAEPETLRASLLAPGYSTADIVARIGLLCRVSSALGQEALGQQVTTLYRTGSSREQLSIMRAIPWLGSAGHFVPLVREAARTNDVDVFAAICHDNPFPALALPDDALFQVVLKSLFLGVGTDRLTGLEKRINGELVRMLRDYEQERLAAHRSVPPDIERIARLHEANHAS